MLDDRNVTRSRQEIVDIGNWDRSTYLLSWQAVLGDRAGEADVSAHAVSARAADLPGLPTTFIAVGELDLFRDEDLAYAMTLMSCGVPTELHVSLGAFHDWNRPTHGLPRPSTTRGSASSPDSFGRDRRPARGE